LRSRDFHQTSLDSKGQLLPSPITARFNSPCAICGRQLRRGQTIYPIVDRSNDGEHMPKFGHPLCMVKHARGREKREDELARQRSVDNAVAALQRAVDCAPAPAPRQITAARNVTEVVRLCENLLGFIPSDSREPPKRGWVGVEAAKLRRAILQDPKVLTLSNLTRAVYYCRAKGISIDSSPAALLPEIVRIHIIPKSLYRPAPVPHPLELAKDALTMFEHGQSEPESAHWLDDLGRAHHAAYGAMLWRWHDQERGGEPVRRALRELLELLEIPHRDASGSG
jgi:hypothetical protein